MSVFFANFIDGYLQSSYSQAQRILRSSQSYGFDWISFEISRSDCEDGLSYLDSYIERQSYTNFSFVKDPAKLEGGGCTSLGSELFFQFGGISSKLINKWVSTLHIPKGYLANPSRSELPGNTRLPDWLNEERYTRRRAGLFTIAYLPNFSLKQNQVPAKIYDTEKILYSLREITRGAHWRYSEDFPAGYTVSERRAQGLERDDMGYIKSSSKSKYVLVDETYHSDFEKIRAYIDPKDIPKARIGNINGTPGAIFEKAAW